MLTTFLRVLMVVFCLGAGSFAHADDMRTPQIPAATSLHYSQQVHDSLSAQHSMQALDTAAHFPQLQCLFKRTLKVNHQQPETGFALLKTSPHIAESGFRHVIVANDIVVLTDEFFV